MEREGNTDDEETRGEADTAARRCAGRSRYLLRHGDRFSFIALVLSWGPMIDTPETRSWRPLARDLLDIVLPLQISTNSSS